MIGKYKIITLCGSTKFKEDFLREQARLTLEGNIVLSIVIFDISRDNQKLLESKKEMIRVLAVENGLIEDTDKDVKSLDKYFKDLGI